MSRLVVGASRQEGGYPEAPPFHPAADVPECPFPERLERANTAYAGVRAAFAALEWDREHFGTREWNPLGHLVKPGDVVLLKPNLVVDHHPRDPNGLVYTVTHGSIVRAVTDYVILALRGRGRIIVADAPQTDSSFATIAAVTGLNALASFYAGHGVDFTVCDLRAEEWRNEGGVIVERRPLPGDPAGYSIVDLGVHSAFYGYRGEGRYYGADYDTAFVNAQHTGSVHRYSLANSALQCDVFINLPKLKTHKKGGITCSLKNLVGINGDKNYLPHHVVGSPADGGDQFPARRAASRLEHTVASALRRISLVAPAVGTPLLRLARQVGTRVFGSGTQAVRSGNWHGNDTVWRMTLDMNRALLYWDRASLTLAPGGPPKRYLSVVDAIVAGAGNGPMDPDPHPFGVVLAGTKPAAVDAAAALLMGFEPEVIPTIREAFRPHALPIATGSWRDVSLAGNGTPTAWTGPLATIDPAETAHFAPHFAWRGRIERTHAREAAG